MSKLYFRYGTVGSAKTLNLLAVAHTYQTQKKKVLLLKPAVDDRFTIDQITSRAGLSKKADYLITEKTFFVYEGKSLSHKNDCYENDAIHLDKHSRIDCILVDEAQFLDANLIDQLHLMTLVAKIPVICYGLKTNFKGFLFEGSKRILELADRVDEIKSTCFFCDHKALFNLKFKDNIPVSVGDEIEIGAEETYKPACKNCYHKLLSQKLKIYG